MIIHELVLHAPMSGPIVPLAEVPDAAFASGVLGDGIAIDPTDNCLCAPCDGEVVTVHRAGHALTLKTRSGLDVLLHIGIDTVTLQGRGFLPQVEPGQQVVLGQPLIRIDLDFVACRAKSLLTLMLLPDSTDLSAADKASGLAEAGKTPVLTLVTKVPVQEGVAGERLWSAPIRLLNPQGLHARPSAALASAAKAFTADIQLQKCGPDSLVEPPQRTTTANAAVAHTTGAHTKVANAKSVVALMGQELVRGDWVRLGASGPDAALALESLAALLAAGLGETCEPWLDSDSDAETEPLPDRWQGVTASPGVALGQLWQLPRKTWQVPRRGQGLAIERTTLKQALESCSKTLATLATSAATADQAAIFEAHQLLATDPALWDAADAYLSQGDSAAYAWQQACSGVADGFARSGTNLLRERATDVRDLGNRVLAILLGDTTEPVVMPSGVILIADELTPSDTARLDPTQVKGLVTVTGGASSHVAIIARAMKLPAIAGVPSALLSVSNGTEALLHADKGWLQLAPSEAQKSAADREVLVNAERDEAAQAEAQQRAVMQCGTAIEVVGNLATLADCRAILASGAEGIGLVRSEFLFLERSNAPTEAEQCEAYLTMAAAFNPAQKVIIRTLDVGGDKPLAYLAMPQEDNPFLGVRGLRLSLRHPALFRTQLRALIRAAAESRQAGTGDIQIMLPMVTQLSELAETRRLLVGEAQQLGLPVPPLGIMVEVPSVVMQAEAFARQVDFFSIGTNDLTQYTLAMDRGHPELAAEANPLHPALLAMIRRCCDAAATTGIWVGVCGGLASDELAAPLLVGLGVRELSGSLPSLPRIKAALRAVALPACEQLALQALAVDSPGEVAQLLADFAKQRL
jgi:multiphosphoryl transfer protein